MWINSLFDNCCCSCVWCCVLTFRTSSEKCLGNKNYEISLGANELWMRKQSLLDMKHLEVEASTSWIRSALRKASEGGLYHLSINATIQKDNLRRCMFSCLLHENLHALVLGITIGLLVEIWDRWSSTLLLPHLILGNKVNLKLRIPFWTVALFIQHSL